jgi:hypothetical protein
MKIAKAKGRLRGTQPQLSPNQEAHLVALHGGGEHTIGELEELFAVTRSPVSQSRSLSALGAAPASIGSGRALRFRPPRCQRLRGPGKLGAIWTGRSTTAAGLALQQPQYGLW